MSQPLNIIIVERTGTLKLLSIKDFKEEELFKKCGFKKSEDFLKQTEWNVKYDSKKYYIQVFAKTDGRANSENKYEFEDLAATAAEDENEEDELANVPKEKKTKQGYLKDGFVVDSSDADESASVTGSEDNESYESEETDETKKDGEENDNLMDNIGSELSEESYDYDSDNVEK